MAHNARLSTLTRSYGFWFCPITGADTAR